MKKLVSVLLAMLLLCGTALAITPEEDEVYQHGLDMIDIMIEEASSDTYVNLFSTQGTNTGSIAETFAQVKDAELTAVYKVVFTESTIKSIIFGQSGAMGFSGLLLQQCLDTLMTGFVNLANTQYIGGDGVSASVLLSVHAAYTGEMADRTIYVYIYDNGIGAVISCIPSTDGTVLLTSYADFSGKIVDIYKGLGLNPVELEIQKKDEAPKTEEGTGKKKGGIIKKSN